MELIQKTSTKTGESLYYKKHESGLDIYLMPRKGYSQNYAIFGTKYGSVDSEFVVPGDTAATKVPDGIAHFLEHKMFDQPDGANVFDAFSQYGGNANAFTSFNMTAYLFSATANLEENLHILMDYVQRPHFTQESVEKEQGIIGQEIRMYDDNAGWKVFFNFLGCLYQNHPVKLEIAGTIDSIAKIDADLLYKCYNTFYNLSNMAIFITGDFDVEKILKIVEENIIKHEPFTEEIGRIYPQEPKEVAQKYASQKLSVAMPMFMTGFKDTDVGYGGEKLLKKIIEMEILVEMLFGKGSALYNELYEQGLINANFSAEYNPQIAYGFTSIDGESRDPKAVYDKMISHIETLRKTGLSKEDFKRMKKVVWGNYICNHNDIEDYAHTFLTMQFMDISYFDYYDVYKTVTFEDVEKRFYDHFRPEASALSVVEPAV